MRVRLDVAYDGGGFAGWAAQPGLRTVEGTLTAGLERILRHPVALTVAGRTDSGVHATGQVVSLDLHELPDLRRLAGVLPDDLVVRAATEVPDSFDARFAALARSYVYRVTDAAPDPLRRHDTLAWRRPLDLTFMRQAAAELVGEHDFAAYCRRREGATTVRDLQQLEIERDGSVVSFRLRADAFCHSMVRALVGALLVVGDGTRPVGLPGEVLRAGVRDGRLPVAAAHGLTLVGVDYPDGEAALLARQQASRRLRVPLRPATEADVPAILALFDEAVEWLVAAGRDSQWGTAPPSQDPARVEQVREGVAAGQTRVAVTGPTVIGVLRVGPAPGYVPASDVPEAYVRLLLTSRGRAPHGLGRELLARVLDQARERGLAQVRLDCHRTPDRALIGYYERAGFTAAGPFDRAGWPGEVMTQRV